MKGHGPGQEVTVPGKSNVRIMRLGPVGHYAVRIVFDDGHDTGLYTWAYLRELGRDEKTRWPAYLEKLADEKLTRGLEADSPLRTFIRKTLTLRCERSEPLRVPQDLRLLLLPPRRRRQHLDQFPSRNLDQCFLLGPRPSLDLAFGNISHQHKIKILRINQSNGQPRSA